MNFSKNLRRYRELAGFKSAKDFAAALDIPYTTYAPYENSTREPKYETLCKIAAALHVSIDDLLGFKLSDLEKCISICRQAGYKVETGPSREEIHVKGPIEERRNKEAYPVLEGLELRVNLNIPSTEFIKLVQDVFYTPDYSRGMCSLLLKSFEAYRRKINELQHMQQSILFNDTLREHHKEIYLKIANGQALSDADWQTIQAIRNAIAHGAPYPPKDNEPNKT